MICEVNHHNIAPPFTAVFLYVLEDSCAYDAAYKPTWVEDITKTCNTTHCRNDLFYDTNTFLISTTFLFIPVLFTSLWVFSNNNVDIPLKI